MTKLYYHLMTLNRFASNRSSASHNLRMKHTSGIGKLD